MSSKPPAEDASGPSSARVREERDLQVEHLRALLLAFAFLVVVAVGTWHHEMWRDEWQGWMLGRDSTSLGELLGQLRVEGHLPAWYLILYALGRVTRDPMAMQVTHVVLATGAIYLLGRFAPFPWLLKVLMAFGYFFAYEYAVLARPYALGVLALFAFCALFPHRRRHPAAVATALVLLAITSLYGLIIAGAACGMLLLEASTESQHPADPRVRRIGARIVLAAWAIGGVLAILVAAAYPSGELPRLTAGGLLSGLSPWALATTASTVSGAYLPFPDLSSTHLWGTHFIPADSRIGLGARAALALGLVASTTLILSRTPFVLFFYLVGTGGLLLFSHLVFGGFLRHHGQLFLLFVACLWLASLQPSRWEPPPWMDRWTGLRTRWAAGIVTGILLVQVASAAVLYGADIRGPFSAAPSAAEFIRKAGLAEGPIAGSPAPPASSIAGLLDRPIHYPAVGGTGTFIRWGRYARGFDVNPSMSMFRPFVDEHPSGALIILGSSFDDWDQDLDVEELARFGAGLEARERYVLYHVRVRRADT